jgi:hypothetical protein
MFPGETLVADGVAFGEPGIPVCKHQFFFPTPSTAFRKLLLKLGLRDLLAVESFEKLGLKRYYVTRFA